jgi:hypothetical protein
MEEPRTEQKNKRTNDPLGEQGDKKDIHALDTTTSLQVHLLPTTTITMHESGTKRGTWPAFVTAEREVQPLVEPQSRG